MKTIKSLFKLLRVYLSLAIAFSGLAGSVLYLHSVNVRAVFCFVGLFFLSCSASALNQLQERKWDLLMKRTADRPLPARRIKPRYALAIAVTFGVSGTSVLYAGCSFGAAFLGVLSLVVYNAMYTPLKRKSRYAVFVGALTGAIPPMAGWTAAGGAVSSPFILAIALFMYLWQVPHFLLLLLRFGGEYSGAGFPLLLNPSNGSRSRRIVFLWLAGTSASTLMFPVFHVITGVAPASIMLAANGIAILFFYRSLFPERVSFNFSAGFRSIYVYQIVILGLLIGNCFSKWV